MDIKHAPLLIKSIIFFLCLARPVAAQQEVPPLVMPFTSSPPFMQISEDGRRTGYFVELAELIGKEVGLPIRYVDVENMKAAAALQSAGKTDFFPGIVKSAISGASNAFLGPVFIDELKLAVKPSKVKEYDTGTLTGTTIGVVPPSMGFNEPILAKNNAVKFTNADTAFLALLQDRIDGLLLPNAYLYRLARDAKLEAKIAFINNPIREISRFVAINKERAELFEPIDKAIEKLQKNGQLVKLAQRYFLNIPDGAPDVLKVAIGHIPPYMIVDGDGEPSGFGIDVLRDLANRTGLRLTFEETSLQQLGQGPATNRFDIVPIFTITPERKKQMDFTFPVRTVVTSIIMRSGEADGIRGLGDLAGQRVGTISNLKSSKTIDADKRLVNVTFKTPEKLLQALMDGKVDAIVSSVQSMTRLAKKNGVLDQLTIVKPPLSKSEVAPALRFGLGAERDRFNAVIPGYLLSDRYAELEERYFGTPVFWTQSRVEQVIIVFLVFVLLGLVVIGYLLFYGRTLRRLTTDIQIIRDELETVFNTVTSGIIAFGKDGRIVRINNKARHFLGSVSSIEPFEWPKSIEFVDSEDLHALDSSADPINRLLSGNMLRQELHLMRRANAGESFRHIRLESSKVVNQDSNISVVLILDDVSEEERQRQVVERKHRLDALGQLTGGIAHDFNNILASQMYAVDLAQRAQDEAKRKNYLTIATSSIQRGKALTSRLLSFARRQPGLASVRRTTDTLDDFKKLIQPMLEEQFELEFIVEDQNLLHFCDQVQLETALINLVLNSRDAMLTSGKGHRIHIKARPVHSPSNADDSKQQGTPSFDKRSDGKAFRYVEISVSDDGPGMENEILARCTDPFFTTKEAGLGSGLGLSMVYGFVKQSDGNLRIYSEEGVGTTVQLTLPRGTSDGSREEAMPADTYPSGHGQTILVVEDEATLLEIMKEILSELGYKVITASSGGEALKIAKAGEKFDLLLTDIVMPGQIGGFELAKQMRKILPEIPILYMSGYTGFTASEMGDVQAPLLQKPTPPPVLADAINSALK